MGLEVVESQNEEDRVSKRESSRRGQQDNEGPDYVGPCEPWRLIFTE